jgi:hypothetical protein
LPIITQTGLLARGAKSFAVKKSLATQVKEFMASRVDSHGNSMTPAAMASLVASHQAYLPVASRCKRQDIENLLKKDFRTTRYTPALAAAMGTTVEELVGVKSVATLQRARPSEATSQSDLSSERITRYVSDVSQSLVEFARVLDKPQRTLLRGLMGDLLSNPEAFSYLDHDQVRALLSDNAFRDDPGVAMTEPSDPFTTIDSHSDTNEGETNHRTERDGTAFQISAKRRSSRS